MALTEPNREVAEYLAQLAGATAEWVDYAQQKLQQGDVAEAQRALETVTAQVAEWQNSSALAMANNVALQEALSVAIGQRDELIMEVETLQEERAWAVDEAFELGSEIGQEDTFTEIYDDPDIVAGVVDQAREDNIRYLIGQLKRVGNEVAASRLEELHQAARDSREQLERVESTAREWYFQLPVEARINAPVLEHEDELDDGELDGQDEDELDYDLIDDEEDGDADA